MDAFKDKIAIVTGGASGIGRAIGTALVRRGGRVVLADINADAAAAAAGEMNAGASAQSRAVDVTDAAAVAELVQETASAQGRLDYMFNNAGIAIMGEASNMTLDDWNRLIDINLRGVVHGVAAAYPLMMRQGFGHIVNTASAAGILPTPGATGYATTKHALVGLSTSLRAEGVRFGVKVSVVCPGVIDTPLKYSTKLLNGDRDQLLADFPLKMYPAESCADDILRGVKRNRAIVVVTRPAQLLWRVYRLAPRVAEFLLRAGAERSSLLERRR